MKRKILSLFVFMTLTIGSLWAQNDNGLIGRARGAAHDCLNNYNVTEWIVFSGIATSEACLNGGFLREVQFYVVPILPPCNPQEEICPSVSPAIVATVAFDCDGNMISVNCY